MAGPISPIGNADVIGGQIPFGSTGNPFQGLASGGLNGLAQQYQTGYQNALAQNQAMYNNIMQGYQTTAQNQGAAQQNIGAGYGSLYNNVLGTIAGVGQAQQQAINDAYAQQAGQTQQNVTDRGLGNTTVSDSLQRGLFYDKQKADVNLANQMAQLSAGYQSQLGLAGLGYANEANMQNTGLANQQLGFMNSVTAKYPNPQDYYNLFTQSGMFNQMNQDRAMMRQAAGSRSVGPVGGGGMPASRGAPWGTNPLTSGLYGGGVDYSGGPSGGGYGGGFGGAPASNAPNSITGGTMYLGGGPGGGFDSVYANAIGQGYDPGSFFGLDQGQGVPDSAVQDWTEPTDQGIDTSYIDQTLNQIYGSPDLSQLSPSSVSGDLASLDFGGDYFGGDYFG